MRLTLHSQTYCRSKGAITKRHGFESLSTSWRAIIIMGAALASTPHMTRLQAHYMSADISSMV